MHHFTSDFSPCWRAASTEAFALYVIVEGCGRAPKTYFQFYQRLKKGIQSRNRSEFCLREEAL
jgi:hypothetical protein